MARTDWLERISRMTPEECREELRLAGLRGAYRRGLTAGYLLGFTLGVLIVVAIWQGPRFVQI